MRLPSIFWLAVGLLCSVRTAAQAQAPLAITNVSVVPLNANKVMPGQTVLIENGKIRAIGSAGKLRLPAGTVTVDGGGKYLLPGLIDMHAHLPGKEGTAHSLDTYFRLNLASGVTGLRSMRGDSLHLRWRDSLRRAPALAPHLYLGSPVLTRDKAYTSAKGAQLLRRYKASGYDFAKYLGDLTAPQYDSLLLAAHALGFPVAGHAPRSGLRGAVAAGMQSIEHIEAFAEAYQQDSVQLKALARQMAANHLYTCPDFYWYQVTWLKYPPARLQSLPGLAYVAPAIRTDWNTWLAARTQQLAPQSFPAPAAAQLAAWLHAYRRAFHIMHEAGVQFLVSPGDGPFIIPGFSMAEELHLLTELGLSPYEALRAASTNAATWLGEQDRRGTIEPGKAADLVLLEANPLTDIGNVRRVSGVVLAGRWLPVAQLLPVRP